MENEREKEQERQLEKIRRKAWKTIAEYGLIEEGDKILIGLSGGKDSLALVEIMGERMKIFRPRFSLVAAHVSVENIPYKSDLAFLENYCAKFDIPFFNLKTSFEMSTDKRKTPCFLCSWQRRKSLFELAKREGCNKIALGHHEGDVLETLMMNLFFQGSFGTMPPLMPMTKFDMKIIRPLACNPESDMKLFAEIRNFPAQEKKCPYEYASFRASVKEMLAQVAQMNPDFRRSMWHAMQNVQTEYLPKKKEK